MWLVPSNFMRTPQETMMKELDAEDYEFENEISVTEYGMLTYNHSSEEGEIELDDELFAIPDIIRLDILQDWLHSLTNLYNEEVSKFSGEGEKRH